MKLSIQNFVDRVNDFKIKNPIEYCEFESIWNIMPPDEFVDVTGEEFEKGPVDLVTQVEKYFNSSKYNMILNKKII